MPPKPLPLESDVAAMLLAWYDVHARVLPWRARPGESADPYAVWLSEVMLQQTTVAAVKAYFTKFLTLWPTVGDLAAAPLDDVMREWAGLGYYSRARNLHAAARHVAEHHGGRFPDTEEGLRQLPGIGAYTAAAIAAIAFGRKASPLDGNIERVMARLFAIETPLPQAKPALKAHAESLTPATRAGDFAQALMDLGATICTPKSPSCLVCPIANPCVARARRIAETLPRRADKPERPVRTGSAFVLLSPAGNILMRRRPPKGLLGGMLELPSSPWDSRTDARGLEHAPAAADWRLAGRVEHGFTHFTIRLDVYRAEAQAEDPGLGLWVSRAEAPTAGLPTLMRKVLVAGLGRGHASRHDESAFPQPGRGRRPGGSGEGGRRPEGGRPKGVR